MLKKIKESAATGYILFWLLGIPIPILLIIFYCAVAADIEPPLNQGDQKAQMRKDASRRTRALLHVPRQREDYYD